MIKRLSHQQIVVKLTTALTFVFFLASCGGGEDQQAKYLERAQAHFEEKNYDKAGVDARNVLQINPKNIAAKTILADISLENGDLRVAFGSYTGILEDDPSNPDLILTARGTGYLFQKITIKETVN